MADTRGILCQKALEQLFGGQVCHLRLAARLGLGDVV